MTTAQQSPNGHKAFPPPCSVENSPEPSPLDLPTDKANSNQNQFATDDQVVERQKDLAANVYPQDELRGVEEDITPLLAHKKVDPCEQDQRPFPANAYHFPPKRYAPKANSYQYDDFASGQTDATPLPDRCQFMFSDGRQCTMARSDIHPSLCRYHSEREEQLFGDPVSGGRVVGAACDLPELFSAAGDLTTARGVNRALAQVFRLFAQRRISRQEAATFAKLGQLLLQSISAARAEFVAAPDVQVSQPVEQPSNGVVERQKGVAITPFLPHENVERGISQELSRVTRGNVILSESDLAHESKDPSASAPVNGAPVQCSPGLSPSSTTGASEEEIPNVSCNQHLNGIDSNSRTISTYKNVEHKPIQNQHLHKNGFHGARKNRPR